MSPDVFLISKTALEILTMFAWIFLYLLQKTFFICVKCVIIYPPATHQSLNTLHSAWGRGSLYILKALFTQFIYMLENLAKVPFWKESYVYLRQSITTVTLDCSYTSVSMHFNTCCFITGILFLIRKFKGCHHRRIGVIKLQRIPNDRCNATLQTPSLQLALANPKDFRREEKRKG